MKEHQRVTAFFLETLLLISVFVAVILTLTGVFGVSRVQSAKAESLTEAVCLAQTAAEAVAASDSVETLAALLDENGNVQIKTDSPVTALRASYKKGMVPSPEGDFWVDITWEPQGEGDRGLVSCRISVLEAGRADEVYTLETAVYVEEAGQ